MISDAKDELARAEEEVLLARMRQKKPAIIGAMFMGDLFHEAVSFEFIDRVFGVMALASQHRFMMLTKRPMRMAEYVYGRQRQYTADAPERLKEIARESWPLPNVWFGVTAENQARADERIPVLLQISAAHYWVSAEPLLGPIDLTHLTDVGFDALYGVDNRRIRLNLVIVGGETGPRARPMHPDWVRSLRDQCKAAGTEFHFNSWGEFCSESQMSESVRSKLERVGLLDLERDHYFPDGEIVYRVGKKRAGRLLDGREHNGEMAK